MQKSTRNKIHSIITWYRMAGRQMSVEKKLRLLKVWKDICVEHEEYEIASALRKERAMLVRAMGKIKIGKRTFAQELKLEYRFIFRKFLRRFKK